MSEGPPSASLPVDPDSRPYWEGCRARELRITRCRSCGRWIHFPRAACPSCWSDDVVAEPVDGRGVLYTWAVFREPAGPYVAAVVELTAAGGVRMPTTVVGCPPEDLTIGMALDLTWIDHHGLPVPAFRPAGTAASAGAAETAGTAGVTASAGTATASGGTGTDGTAGAGTAASAGAPETAGTAGVMASAETAATVRVGEVPA